MSFIIASLAFWKGKTKQKSVELPTSGKVFKSAACAERKKEKMQSKLQKNSLQSPHALWQSCLSMKLCSMQVT